MSKRTGPRGSELVVRDWLEQRPDIEDVRYVGDAGEGPPDFLARFHGVEVAIEVTRMPLDDGWSEHRRIAFEKELCRVVQSVKDDPHAPRWHVTCRIDPRQPRPPRRNGDWRERLREALSNGSAPGSLQLMAESERVREGVVVDYFPASNDGSLPAANQLGGYSVVGAGSTRILDEVRAKALKVGRSRRAREHADWWLVLDDDVVIVHGQLDAGEWRQIRDVVAASDRIDAWSKVILVSRRTRECTAVYERAGQPELDEGHGRQR